MRGDQLKAMLTNPSNSRCGTPESVTKPTPHSQCESYRRLMKNTKLFSPLMWLLLGTVALAQAGSTDVPEAPLPQDPDTAKIEAAKVEATKIEPTAEPKAGASSEGKLISQARRFPHLHPGRTQQRDKLIVQRLRCLDSHRWELRSVSAQARRWERVNPKTARRGAAFLEACFLEDSAR